jgi:AcrR family transcriptional regulator
MTSSREVSRQAVRKHIEAVAMDLFVANGFDATTVDQIATAAGVSPRSFFRYFPTQEDVVIGDPMEFGVILRDALLARPDDEGAADAVQQALDTFVDSVNANPAALGISTVMLNTPSLRAKHIEKTIVWEDLLLPEVRRRLGDAAYAEVVARAIVAAGLATFHAVLMQWADGGGREELRVLLAAGFRAGRF